MAETPTSLVEAVAVALDERFTSGVDPISWEETAEVAARSLLAALPACQEAMDAVERVLAEDCYDIDEAARVVLVALAILGGSEP